MQDAVPVGKGSMIAVIGENINTIKELINSSLKKGSVCEIANDNAEGRSIISGGVESINIFKATLKQKAIKFIPLKVSAPFHCSLMKPAADHMKNKIESTKFKNLKVEIISNVTAEPENNTEKIKKLLIEQIFFDGKMAGKPY